ncbi:MAG: prephenate dehydratase domain-containing protein [Candidatus Velthaea sp.]|jgi:prephenate dehydratase
MPTIGFQGEPGAFSDQAAQALVPSATTRGFLDFDSLIAATAHGSIDAGLLPIENSIFGAIARSYDLLWETPGLHIVDETAIAVEMCLIGVPGATEDEIVEVRSHPVALEQVRRFTDTHPEWQRTVVDDTAGAVAEIMKRHDRSIAAIGPAFAAAHYGATVLRRAIQDDAQNFTRFYLLATAPAAVPRSDRAVVGIEIPHRPGSLRDALGAFADRQIDLRNIVARPNHVDPFHYRFFFEIRALDAARLAEALAAIDGSTRLFGRY